MHTLFILLPDEHNHSVATEELERTLQLMLRRREVTHTSRAYWDDTRGFAEYGVRLDISEPFCDEHFERLLGEIVIVTARLYGEIRIGLGE